MGDWKGQTGTRLFAWKEILENLAFSGTTPGYAGMGDWKGQVAVFSISGCPHCKAAKALLKELEVPYVEMDLSGNKNLRAWLLDKTGKRTVPQIFLNDLHVGGNAELVELNSQDKLKSMLDQVKNTPTPEGAPKLPDDISDLDDDVEAIVFTCEPDLQAKIAAAMRGEGGLSIKDRRYHLILYTKCFTGNEFVDWMVANAELTKCKTAAEAIEAGNDMMKGGLFDHVKSDHVLKNEELFYRFAEDDPKGSKALNAPTEGQVACQPQSAGELGKQLRVMILKLYDQFLSADGRSVDYDGIGKSELFKDYQEMATRLMRVDLSVPHEEKLAFLINIYNALVIHKTVVEGKPTSTWQRFKFFTRPGYIIAGHTYSLNDIENGLIRGNKPPPMSSKKQFAKKDPRIQFAIKKLDPRIHFALVCGAASCPPIKTYDAANVEEALTAAAMSFFERDGIVLDEAKSEVSITRICKWYRSDFGRDDLDVVGWIASFLEGEKRDQCIRMLMMNPNLKINYQKYDWGSNSKK
mmetsp:Transcript_35680/g.83205  ORF Transcript_35680/g.83205 Transcript_35680/m.83205 type:complete len:522 (-) Transcript_35680:117-1682(-)